MHGPTQQEAIRQEAKQDEPLEGKASQEEDETGLARDPG